MSLTLNVFLELYFTNGFDFFIIRSDEFCGIAFNQLAEDQIIIDSIDEDGIKTFFPQTRGDLCHELLHFSLSFLCLVSVAYVFLDLSSQVSFEIQVNHC